MSKPINIFIYSLSLVLLCFTQKSKAQNDNKVIDQYEKQLQQQRELAAQNNTLLLPDINIQYVDGQGIVLDWYNQYDLIKSIAIQRSQDSTKNYSTVGYLEQLPKGKNSFVDQKFAVGKNYYRLLIVFSSDLNWYSNMSSVAIDTPTFQAFYSGKQAPVANNPDVTSNNSKPKQNTTTQPQINTTNPLAPNFIFTPSTIVFYEIFDRQIHVNLGNKMKMYEDYSLTITDPASQKELLHVGKLPDNYLVIDSRNVNKKGFLKFEIKKGGITEESGFINIQ